MSERKRHWRWIIGLVMGAMIVGAYLLSPRLLYEDSPRERADVIRAGDRGQGTGGS